MLRDRGTTQVTWVTLPEPMALEETSDALAALDAAGIRVTALIVNRMTAARRRSVAHWCERAPPLRGARAGAGRAPLRRP